MTLRTRMPRAHGGLVAGLLVATFMTACSEAPRTIHLGSDSCDHCHMTISEERFAAQLVTDRGRTYVFDSVECMAEFVGSEAFPEGTRSLWVTDFAEPGSWVRAEEARFLRSDDLRSPMGMGFGAFASRDGVDAARAELGGEVLDWDGVLRYVAANPVRGMGHSHGH